MTTITAANMTLTVETADREGWPSFEVEIDPGVIVWLPDELVEALGRVDHLMSTKLRTKEQNARAKEVRQAAAQLSAKIGAPVQVRGRINYDRFGVKEVQMWRTGL